MKGLSIQQHIQNPVRSGQCIVIYAAQKHGSGRAVQFSPNSLSNLRSDCRWKPKT